MLSRHSDLHKKMKNPQGLCQDVALYALSAYYIKTREKIYHFNKVMYRQIYQEKEPATAAPATPSPASIRVV